MNFKIEFRISYQLSQTFFPSHYATVLTTAFTEITCKSCKKTQGMISSSIFMKGKKKQRPNVQNPFYAVLGLLQ